MKPYTQNKTLQVNSPRSKRNFSSYAIVLLLLSLLISTSACPGKGDRGSYYLYGLQWGMSWQEVREVLKVRKLHESESKEGIKIAYAPFFIAGVPGRIQLKFRKKWGIDPALKSILYEADIPSAGIRAETFGVIMWEMKGQFGPPSLLVGSLEKGDEGKENEDKYWAEWENADGDIVVEADPKTGKIIIRAEADTSNPKLKWLD